MAVKQEVIERAKQLPCYFAQIYEVKVRSTPLLSNINFEELMMK